MEKEIMGRRTKRLLTVILILSLVFVMNLGTMTVNADTKDMQAQTEKNQTEAICSEVWAVNNSATAEYSGNFTVESGKAYLIFNSGRETNVLKFKATKTGFVAVSGGYFSGYVQLYSGEKALSKTVYISNGVSSGESVWMKGTYFGVKKGKTYSFHMKPIYLPNKQYAFKYVNYSVKENSGSTKSKAKTIKRNKLRKGTITAGSKKADWYKFRTTKKKLVLKFSGAVNDTVKVKLYHRNGSVSVARTLYLTRSRGYKYTAKGSGVKGTWYAKVYRGTSSSSGYYKLQWK